MKLRFAFDRIWRAPSFTELYYLSPSNIGNASLSVQKTNNFEWGLDYFPKDGQSFSFAFFLRQQADTIDWVKNLSSSPWEAKNIGNLNVYGLDFYGQINFRNELLRKFSLGYTYLNLAKDNPYQFSKYVFDYNRHKVVNMLGLNLGAVAVDVITNFAYPLGRKRYASFDFKAEKKLSKFTLTLEGINIFDKNYQEMEGIAGSGRLIKVSLTYSF